MPQPRSTTRKAASKPAARSTAKRSATAKASAPAKRGATTKPSTTAKAGATTKGGAAAKRGPATKRGAAAKSGAAATRSAGAKQTTARAPAKRAGTAKRATTAKRTTASTRTAAKRPAARRPSASSRTSARAGRPDEFVVAALTAVRDNLTRGIVLTGERLQEAIDDSVRRGRITRDDAEDLAQSLIDIGRKQSQELMAELEALINGQSVRDAARSAGKLAIKNVETTAKRAQRSPVADRALREVDRARRATGLVTFPITGYDQLTVNQITTRLTSLAAPELRKVRDYERRHANRKSVLSAIEKQLSR
jgi:polyhydroxyalkanoate synthesis regulator phasin